MSTEATSKYLLDDSGRLHREGHHIATLNDENEMVFHDPADRTKYGAAVTRWLREEAEKKDTAPPPADAVATTDVVPVAKPLDEKQRQIAEAKSLAAEGEREIAKAQADVADDRAFATRTGCPPPPKKNPQFGDKTPNYVEWLKTYRPDKFASKYGVKGKGQVPVFKVNPETGIEEHVGYREADMAIRKTHLTEKIESIGGLGDDMDWNA